MEKFILHVLMRVDQKLLETEFLIAICRKWQAKAQFLGNLDLHSLTVKSVFDCRLPGVRMVNKPQQNVNWNDLNFRISLIRRI